MPSFNSNTNNPGPTDNQVNAKISSWAPAELAALPGWLVWRYESRPGSSKPLKVPYYAESGKRYGTQGASEDRSKLVTFAAAKDAAIRRGMDGVGLAMLPDWGLTALDFDHCVGADGALPAEIEAIVDGTYAEYSPSGTGVRAFVKGHLGNWRSHISDGWAYGFETFCSKGFVTFTGNILPRPDSPRDVETLLEASETLRALCKSRFAKRVAKQELSSDASLHGFESFSPLLGKTEDEMKEHLSVLDPDMGRDQWIRVGMAVHHETGGGEAGFVIWDEWSSKGAKYPGADDLRYQWESFTRREGRTGSPVTFASVIRMFNEADPDRFKSGATAECLQAVAAEKEQNKRRFQPVSADGLCDSPPGDWLIKGVLPRGELVVVYGASGSGKTFVVLDMACTLALGEPWRGHRVKQSRVLIIAAEGGANIGKRIKAFRQRHGLEAIGPNLHVITAAPNFMLTKDVDELIGEVMAIGSVDLIAVDTLARVTPGANENASDDMGRALGNANALAAATGATVLLVHHAGKDASRGSRGWSGIKGALDAEIEVTRDETLGRREIKITKMKDGEDGTSWGFSLETVQLGFDEDGDAITSCVVVPDDRFVRSIAETRKDKKKKCGGIQRKVLEILKTIQGTMPEGIPKTELATKVLATMPPKSAANDGHGKRDQRLSAITRAIDTLCSRGELSENEGLITLAERRA
jgi:hypothetical protein